MRKALDPTPPLRYTSDMSTTNTTASFETNGIILGDWLRSNRPDLWERVRSAKVFTGQKIPVWVNGEVVQKQDTVALVDIGHRMTPYYLGLITLEDGSKELQHVASWRVDWCQIVKR